jgi:hypothetical protein
MAARSARRPLALGLRVLSLEALLAEARARDSSPHAPVEGALAKLSDAQIRSVLGPAVRLRPEELARIRDLPGYSARLVELALDGLIAEPASTSSPALAPATASFSAGADATLAPGEPEPTFAPDAGRITASFPVAGSGARRVMIKWLRRDEPALLLFCHYDVPPGEELGRVWLEPSGGWQPGDYRVEVFSGDEALELLASGGFGVR